MTTLAEKSWPESFVAENVITFLFLINFPHPLTLD